jgi:cell shape-determining protein MreC
MARSAHPETSRRGPLAAAVLVTLILCFLPRGALAYLTGPRRLIEYILVPVSDPVLAIARWFLPPAAKPDDPRVAFFENEILRYKKLLLDAQDLLKEKQKLIDALQKGSIQSDGAFRQLPASVVGITSSGSGGVITVRAGSKDGVERNTIASTEGVQLVGRVSEVGAVNCKVTLITEKASGPIDGVIFADDGARLAVIRNISPQVGKRVLVGQVQHASPAPPDPKPGDTVRLDDQQSWPRSAQRLTIGVVTAVDTSVGGRILVTIKPSSDLERLGEVVLLLTPKAEAQPGGGP